MKLTFEASIQSEGPDDTKIIDKILDLFPARMERQLESIHSDIHKLKEILMGLTEDFAQFVADVNARTNEIGTALAEIQADIERLIAANTNTPPEVLAEMDSIRQKLATLSATSTAIAALDNPVVPPPVEPPPVEPPPEEPL